MSKQKGMVLIASLIILILCSFIAVGIGRFAITSKQDASGHFAQLRGYVDATAAMTRAEYLIWDALMDASKRHLLEPPTGQEPATLVTDIDNDAYWWRNKDTWLKSATKFTDYDSNTGAKPRFRIEKREFVPNSLLATDPHGVNVYRVISRGGGDGEQTSNMIESYYRTPAERK